MSKSKLNALLSKNPDILLLSELKLNDPTFISKIKNALGLSKKGPYEMLLHSGLTARGVAIVIKSSLFDSYSISYKCPDFIALIAKFIKHDLTFQVVCNYLDNSNNQIFLQNLTDKVEKGVPTIWG